MAKYNLIIPGKPYANMRERHCSVKGRSWVYEAKIQKDRKKEVIDCIKSQLPFTFKIIDSPVCVSINVHFGIPKIKRKSIFKGDHHIKKPDIDNIIKFYLDCLTNIVLIDDCIVFSIRAIKYYTDDPRVEILIE